MAFSRDDNAKTLCKLNEQNKGLGYMLNVPGNGLHPDYFNDPQIRLQKFGANLSKNVVELGNILSNSCAGRTSDNDITIADLTGIAAQDIAITSGIIDAAAFGK